jgi:hypothetical protein
MKLVVVNGMRFCTWRVLLHIERVFSMVRVVEKDA